MLTSAEKSAFYILPSFKHLFLAHIYASTIVSF